MKQGIKRCPVFICVHADIVIFWYISDNYLLLIQYKTWLVFAMYDPEEYGLETEDVPTWMRPQLRGIDWTLLATIALCFAVAWPLIIRNGIPRAPEAEPQMFRILAMSKSLQSGTLYPRWAAEFNYGYGSPIFNHIAPLPYYLGGAYVTLTRDGPHVSLKVMMIVAIFLAGISLMSFVRRRWGDFAGLFAASLLLFSPYVVLTGSYLQIDLGSMWALGLFTTLLWMLDRALVDGRGRNLILVALTGGALLVSDAALSPLYFALATGWVIWIIVLHHREVHWKLAILGLLCGIGISMFYYMPAMLEKDAIQWQVTPTYPTQTDLSQLFQPTEQLDPSAFNSVPVPQLGIATWLLGITGAIWLLGMSVNIIRKRQRSTPSKLSLSIVPQVGAAVFFIPVSIILILAMQLPENNIWSAKNNFEALRPEDLLGVITVSCVLIAAQTIVMLETILKHISRRLLAAIILVAIAMFSAANGLYTPDFMPIQGNVSATQHFNMEVRGHALGTFRNGRFLPKDVEVLPRLTNVPFNANNPDQTDIIEPQSLPQNARHLAIISQSETSHDLQIESRTESSVTLLSFNYPGWQAIRDGQSLDLNSTQPEGLINIPLREGTNEIKVHFTDTPNRRTSWLISGGFLLSVIVVGLGLERRAQANIPPMINPLIAAVRRERQIFAVVISIAFIILCIWMRLKPELITTSTLDGGVPSGATTFSRIIQGGISFLGYDFNTSKTVNRGQNFLFKTFWHANSPNLPGDYQIDIFLVRAETNNQAVYHTNYRHIANFPSKVWLPQGYIISQYEIRIPDDIESGQYQIALQVGTCDQTDLMPCNNPDPHDVYTLQGPTGKQIILPTSITVE